MDEPYGRVFAVVYLITRPILVAGIVVLNVTDGIAVWVVCILASSAVAMTVLAIILSRRTREESGSVRAGTKSMVTAGLGAGCSFCRGGRRAWQILQRRAG